MKITLFLLICSFLVVPCVAQERVAFWTSLGVLGTSAALDYHSGLQASRRGYVEMNPLGTVVGSFGSAALNGVLGYYIHRKANRRWKWLGIALMNGTAAWHFQAAAHNYRLE